MRKLLGRFPFIPFTLILGIILVNQNVFAQNNSSFLRVCKEIPENKFLLNENKIIVIGDKLETAKLQAVIRQKTNISTLSIGNWKLRTRLIAHNLFSEKSVQKKHAKLQAKALKKNRKKRAKEIKITEKRRIKAIEKGKSKYYPKVKFKSDLERFDSLSTRLSLKERIRYKFGEQPVILDSFLAVKSVSQLKTYMKKLGYYSAQINLKLDTISNTPKKRKINALYTINTGPRFYIDSVYVISKNTTLTNNYLKYIRKEQNDALFNPFIYSFLSGKKVANASLIPFDSNELENYRNRIAKKMRDEAIYGFSPTQISYIIDTARANHRVSLGIKLTDFIERSPVNKDSLITRVAASTIIKNVYFHIVDTTLYKGNFEDSVKFKTKVQLNEGLFLPTLDTFYFNELKKRIYYPDKKNWIGGKVYIKSKVNKRFFNLVAADSIVPNVQRYAYFYYNGKLFVQPGVIEAQNYLEKNFYYKEYYLERSYNRLLQLGLFSTIKPEFKRVPGTDSLEIHYYLIPAKKQSFSIEPRMTNSNGFLGASLSFSYSNKNLLKTGTNMSISFSGGLESRPTVFLQRDNAGAVDQAAASFNTLEIGPTIKFDIPGFLPINIKKLDKRSRSRTVLSTAFNFQKRPDFSRRDFQLNYLWRFYVGKTQIFSAGLPFASVIKFVSLQKSSQLSQRINAQNDLFLRNAYSDQVIWEDFKLIFDYDNRDKEERKLPKLRFTFNALLNNAGNTLYAFNKIQRKDTLGRHLFLGIPYSQFSSLDTKIVSYYTLTPKKTLAFRLQLGMGIPYGNVTTSLPYDYSFFAGGSNDNRGFVARSLGPGSYKYYLDTTRTATQIGDMRMGTSIELRLGKGTLQSAFFFDAGNIWTYNSDLNRIGGQFSKNWYKELALTFGYGLRIDFDFFVFRIDLGLPLTNPALPIGERWLFQSHKKYYEEIATLSQKERDKLSFPFIVQPHFGIGFPF